MSAVFDGTNGITLPSWNTAGRPAVPSTGQTGYNSTLNAVETYNGTAWGTSGLHLVGYAEVPIGSATINGIDVSNCFTAKYRNYRIAFHIYGNAAAPGVVSCNLALETAGSGLTGVNFTAPTFPTGYNWTMRFQQMNGASTGVQQGSGTNYAELFGTVDNTNTGWSFVGETTIFDAYANTPKLGHTQGIMINPTPYFEDSGFQTTGNVAARGVRIYVGTTAGSNTPSVYGNVRVYGLA